jgi:hypothetical protein
MHESCALLNVPIHFYVVFVAVSGNNIAYAQQWNNVSNGETVNVFDEKCRA